MRRVCVMGSSGSGKTTVSAELARLLGAVHVELDALHHGPNWTEATAGELRARVTRAIEGLDVWVVDGNYQEKLGDLVLRQADTVVWLDLPLRTCLARLWHRTRRRIGEGVELWNGNRESVRGAFWGRESLFWWTIRHHGRRRRVWPARFARVGGLHVIRLRAPAEVEALLAAAEASRAGSRLP